MYIRECVFNRKVAISLGGRGCAAVQDGLYYLSRVLGDLRSLRITALAQSIVYVLDSKTVAVDCCYFFNIVFFIFLLLNLFLFCVLFFF